LQVTGRWRLIPSYTFLQMKITRDAASQDDTVEGTVGDSPKHQGGLRSSCNLPHNLEWDAAMYYVSPLALGPVPAYTRVDTRFGWRARESLELSVAGQNLLTPRHLEFFDGVQVHPTRVERSVVGKITWRF
jgi:iron complex outermembrane recepter protein